MRKKAVLPLSICNYLSLNWSCVVEWMAHFVYYYYFYFCIFFFKWWIKNYLWYRINVCAWDHFHGSGALVSSFATFFLWQTEVTGATMPLATVAFTPSHLYLPHMIDVRRELVRSLPSPKKKKKKKPVGVWDTNDLSSYLCCFGETLASRCDITVLTT